MDANSGPEYTGAIWMLHLVNGYSLVFTDYLQENQNLHIPHMKLKGRLELIIFLLCILPSYVDKWFPHEVPLVSLFICFIMFDPLLFACKINTIAYSLNLT